MNIFKLFYALKILACLIFITDINIANASVVTVKVEDAGVFNWDSIQKVTPGFGSSGPISLNWDPNDDLFTELLAYNRGYSGGAAAFCWHGENCALELSVTAENTTLQLESFTLGYFGDQGIVEYNVIDLETDVSVFSGAPLISGTSLSLFDVNTSSNKGFLILFGPDGFNGGINNITYNYHSNIITTHVPVPTAIWLFGSGLIGLIGFARQPRFASHSQIRCMTHLN
jgi:hypothetical protein